MNKKTTDYQQRYSFSSINTRDDTDAEDQSENGGDHGIIVCLLNKNGTLGAAYYNFDDKTLNIYEEIEDAAPQYMSTATLVRETSPKYILTFGYPTETYVQTLLEIRNSDGSNTTTTTSSTMSIPPNFFLVSLRQYTYEECKRIILNIKLASNVLEEEDQKQEILIRSFVNLDFRLSVQASGALCSYLDRNWSKFGVNHSEDHYLHINQVTLKHHVHIDNQSFKALQIFSPKSHESGFKRGQEYSNREGLSVYKLFMYGCKSKMGQIYLRHLLLSPINDRQELKQRLDFIKFVENPANTDLIINIQDNIKQLDNVGFVGGILGKIQNSRATNKDWINLHKMIYHPIFINDICRHFREKSELFEILNQKITDHLLMLLESISNALDFNAGSKCTRPVIKFGLDPQLDAKQLRRQDISKHITAAARIAVNELPDYINECKISYLPEMGHQITIKEWEPDCDPEQLQYLGYQFMFSLGGILHYKNPLCVELDRRLGDIDSEIIDHENRIIRRLSSYTLKYNKDIREALKVIAKIDCLIAMAKVSLQNNYVKPELNDQRVHEIVESRHPLMEQILTSFEPNDFSSGGPHSHVKIITGANGSGKSIFLKQILLTIYLAHVGCYVPAKKANIGMVESFHCLMHSSDAAVVRLSSFMAEVTQASQALHYWKPSSIIIMDEFGRGTLDDDGLILLTSFLKNFLNQRDSCPHILVSTHMQRISNWLPENRYLEYFKMDHTFKNGVLCFLHKISKGISKSFAFDIVEAIQGVEQANLARKYFQFLQQGGTSSLPQCSVNIQRKFTQCLDLSNVNEIEEDECS